MLDLEDLVARAVAGGAAIGLKDEAAPVEFNARNFCGDHAKAYEYLTAVDEAGIALTSRRAAKSTTNAALLMLTAGATPSVQCTYIGPTQDHVQGTMIRQVWEPMAMRWGWPSVRSDMTCQHPVTGSWIRFGSLDARDQLTTYLGYENAGGVVIIDEAQEFGVDLLKPLVEEVIEPSLSSITAAHPTPGKLRLTGTVPTTPHGYFLTKFRETNAYRKFSWNRFDNPFLLDQRARLAATCAKLGVSELDPLIRRTWFGELCWDAKTNAYRFDRERHTYATPAERVPLGPFSCLFAPQQGCDRFIVGIDQAQRRDRFAFVAWGWHHTRKDRLIQIAEAVTEPGADPLESEWLAVCKELRRRYVGPMQFVRDSAAATAPINDTLRHSHGIIIESAVKGPGSVKARVDRLADLLNRNVAKVIKGSELDEDLAFAKWSDDALERSKWELDKSQKSPDLADAGSYALGLPLFSEIGATPDAPETTVLERAIEQQRQYVSDLLAGKVRPAKSKTPEPFGGSR